jgi:hypothetical protein
MGGTCGCRVLCGYEVKIAKGGFAMRCPKCNGYMVMVKYYHMADSCTSLTCINCSETIDSVIISNREWSMSLPRKADGPGSGRNKPMTETGRMSRGING